MSQPGRKKVNASFCVPEPSANGCLKYFHNPKGGRYVWLTLEKRMERITSVRVHECCLGLEEEKKTTFTFWRPPCYKFWQVVEICTGI